VAAEQAARDADQPPLDVDEGRRVRLQQQPVLEQERAFLGLLCVAQVVEEIVAVVEGADEGRVRGGVEA
jgi:hypothetical protein